MNEQVLYGGGVLPSGVRSRLVDNNNGCVMHVLEAGFESPGRPCVVLLHGFPELAFSWRKQLTVLAAAGFHVVAPDHRGYGRSTGVDVAYDDELRPYTVLNHVSDTLGLVYALGHREVAAVVGHDYGSPVAAWCALVRPDVFRSVVLMSAPFAGPPTLPAGAGEARRLHPAQQFSRLEEALLELQPPRRHYQSYFASRPANADLMTCPQGVRAFLRAYYHHKSGDWPGNRPHRLEAWDGGELAKMPTYYVMEAGRTMPETVAPHMPSPEEVAACAWLTDEELGVYAGEYARTGFQGGLQCYRLATDPSYLGEMRAFSGRTIDVPAMYVAGARDWGSYQKPGDLERMAGGACSRMTGVHLVDGAGHWVQQEAADEVNRLLGAFLEEVAGRAHRTGPTGLPPASP